LIKNGYGIEKILKKKNLGQVDRHLVLEVKMFHNSLIEATNKFCKFV
jgi:hypothetical protein